MTGIRITVAVLVVATAAFADEALEQRLKAMEARMEQLATENAALRAEVDALKGKGPAAPAEAPTARPEEKKKDAEFSVGWKDGFQLKSGDGNFSAHLGGRILLQSRHFIGETRASDTFLVREARIQADGTFYKDYEYKVEGDFGRGTVQLQDGYVGWKRHPEYSLRIGQMKEPFSLETLNSSRFMSFVERSPMSLLAPGRDIGLLLHGKAWEERLEYGLGVFNGNGRNVASDANDDKDVVARLVVKPFAPSEDPWTKGIRVGGAITYGSEKQAFGSLAAPDSGTTFLTMTSGVRSRQDRRRLNVEGAWLVGPVKLQGEATWMDLELHRFASGLPDNKVEGDAEFGSYYVEGLCVLTGEDAVLDRRKPKRNLLSDGGIGQVEVALRFSQFWTDEDLFDEGFATESRSTDGYDNWTAGVNWWLNPYTRVSLNYFHNEFWDDVLINGKSEGDEDGLVTRFQIDF